MKNKIIVLVGVGVLFLFAGVMYLQQNQDTKHEENTEIIEESSLDITAISSSITPNTGIWFKDKNVFRYSELTYGDENYSKGIRNYTFVVGLERINKTDEYVINATYGDEEPSLSLNIRYYIDKNTYKIIKIEGISLFPDSTVIEGELAQIIGNEMSSGMGMLFYGYWMLGLNETFKIKEEIHGKFGGRDGSIIATYEVIGKEKIWDRETYKVKVNIKHKIDEQEVNKEGVVWIDEEKRIVTKFIEYSKNLPIREINIIS